MILINKDIDYPLALFRLLMALVEAAWAARQSQLHSNPN
jgi:hypothetical protein